MLFTAEKSISQNEVGCGADHAAGMLMQVASVEKQDYQPSPLPSAWILEGNPEAKSLPLAASADGRFTCGRWACSKGRFKFIYACDEIVQIMEGKVTIEQGNHVRTLHAGDVAFFPQGMVAIWTIHEDIKKFAIFRSQPGSLFRRVARKIVNRLRSLFAAA